MEVLYLFLGLFTLQGFLSALRNKLFVLILPAINFLWSLLMFFNILALPDISRIQLFLTSLITLIIFNIPTFVFFGISFLVIKRQEKVQRDLVRSKAKEALQA